MHTEKNAKKKKEKRMLSKEQKKEYMKKWHQDHKEQVKKWYQDNKERLREYNNKYDQEHKEQKKEYRYKKKYNLTLEEIDQLLITQNYKCLICGESLLVNKRHIDHNYKTGKVRGILCAKCNTGLGQFRDNSELLRKAVVYMETKE